MVLSCEQQTVLSFLGAHNFQQIFPNWSMAKVEKAVEGSITRTFEKPATGFQLGRSVFNPRRALWQLFGVMHCPGYK